MVQTVSPSQHDSTAHQRRSDQWTPEDHARYLEALERFPDGPWRVRAAYIGTRTARQVITHAQKIALRLERHARGLRPAGRPRSGTGRHSAPSLVEKGTSKAEPKVMVSDSVALPSHHNAIHTSAEISRVVDAASARDFVTWEAIVETLL